MAKNNSKGGIDFSLKLKNIGKHQSLDFKEKINSLRIALYAMNGSGKTFISRAFRLAEMQNTAEQNSMIDKVNDIVSFDSNNAKIQLHIKNLKNQDQFDLDVELTRDKFPRFNQKIWYIFHVFNSDYILENIQSRQYEVNGNIDGYIIGKENIDLNDEKAKRSILEEQEKDLKKKINNKIQEGLKELTDLKISPRLKEYQNITFDNIVEDIEQGFYNSLNFSSLANEYKNISSDIEEYKDIENIDCVGIDDVSFLSEIQTKLEKEYSKSNFAEDFLEKMKSKKNFIELGVNNIKEDNSNCPFCEQKLDDNARDLINKYNEFLDAEETKLLKFIECSKSNLYNFSNQIKSDIEKSKNIQADYDRLKVLFKQKELDSLQNIKTEEIELLHNMINAICLALENKSKDITQVISIKDYIEGIKKYIDTTIEVVQYNNKLIASINSLKNNSKDYVKELKIKICQAKMLEIKNIAQGEIEDYKNNIISLKELNESILAKQEKAKKSKKEEFIKTFSMLLDVFFQGKYSFSKSDFCLTLNNAHKLKNKTTKVLSDGEKSIIAFCHYIAESHIKISQADEYKKIFFIIDDPMSSMDYHYVYSVSSVIRDLQNYVPSVETVRFLILTHNVDFYNMLIKNKITKDNFILENGKIIKINENKYILPYIEQLKEIYEIFLGKEKPKYHTANSIRNVLESVGRFFYPTNDLHDVMQKLGLMDLYSFVNDGSHGSYANQKPITDTNIKDYCEKLIEVLKEKIPGQIKMIEDENKGELKNEQGED
ncbi:AAA family ATPase [Campylobacter jejuni]|nr:AAA family ATPase [Campylobacter jejuni]EDP7140968.1 AAA family ATPase [Campylobacter jejuni]EHI6452125.1 AAA family ATPase [Campylobacter jejuni]EHQ5918349.1 AAA family ATPase [Campylobacter jejuni]EKS1210527.1 AAA family ATPase [Campylobacter jejuni]